MRIQIMSDLHMEFGSKFAYENCKDTTLILAGDIDNDLTALKVFIWHTCKEYKDVLMVAGNHEFYGHEWADVMVELRALGNEIDNFHFLENDIFKAGDITFIGATLWSSPNWGVFRQINDHHQTTHKGRKLSSDDITGFNEYSTEYIKYQLENLPGRKIVVTHFGPDQILMHPRWMGNPEMNTYFWASGFQDHFQYADMWIYGHTHDSQDMTLDGCHCICNPYGYHQYEHNPNFDDYLIMDI